MVKPLNEAERAFIDHVIVIMPRRAMSNYLAYRQTNGFMPKDFYQVELSYDLHRKGWLDNYSDLFEQNAVWLSHDAWLKISLMDWEEVEERSLENERGDLYGSW